MEVSVSAAMAGLVSSASQSRAVATWANVRSVALGGEGRGYVARCSDVGETLHPLLPILPRAALRASETQMRGRRGGSLTARVAESRGAKRDCTCSWREEFLLSRTCRRRRVPALLAPSAATFSAATFSAASCAHLCGDHRGPRSCLVTRGLLFPRVGKAAPLMSRGNGRGRRGGGGRGGSWESGEIGGDWAGIGSRNHRIAHRIALIVMSTGGIVEFSSEDFVLDRMLGTYGYLNVSSYTPPSPGARGDSIVDENAAAGYDLRDMERLGGQVLEEGEVQIRLYVGRIIRGERRNVRVILKAYPGRRAASGARADAMAANELAAHATLQTTADGEDPSANICKLLGGFQTRAGEQWLVFRNDGTITAADYALAAAQASSEGMALGEGEIFDRFDRKRPIRRRWIFVTKLLRGILQGLACMHSRGRLHQSLGPASVILNTVEERDVLFLTPRLRDLAFSVDVSDQAIFRGDVPLDMIWDGQGLSKYRDKESANPLADVTESLWRRASSAGAKMALQRKAFGIADDIYAAGLLVAYLAFIPFCEVGSIDGPALQKLLERTFRLDIAAARDYCAADDRWKDAVEFLDLGQGAGWNLLQAMLNPDYRQRPTAEAVMKHPFLTGEVLV